MLLEEAITFLNSENIPQNQLFCLACNKIDANGAQELAQALELGNAPSELELDLYGNDIGAEGAKAFAKALESGKCPLGIKLYLDYCGIGDEGAKALANALESGKCPQGLELYLECCDIGVQGAKALANALKSGKCPQGLCIILNNDIGDAGIEAFAQALESGMAPDDLLLDIASVNISSTAVQSLARALTSKNRPLGLKFISDPVVEKILFDAIQNEKVQNTGKPKFVDKLPEYGLAMTINIPNPRQENALGKIRKLLSICSVYRDHFDEDIKIRAWRAQRRGADIDTLDAGTKKCYQVNRLIEILERQGPSSQQKLDDFKQLYPEVKATLIQHRDNAVLRFLKYVAMVLTMNLASSLGLWRVRGADAAQEIEDIEPALHVSI